jgi:hypothetical protein
LPLLKPSSSKWSATMQEEMDPVAWKECENNTSHEMLHLPDHAPCAQMDFPRILRPIPWLEAKLSWGAYQGAKREVGGLQIRQ